MSDIQMPSTEAGQHSSKQLARKGWVRRTALLPRLPLLLAVAIVAGGVVWASLSAPVQALVPLDYDRDNDGLIEVSNLAQLNAIRWDVDGNGSTDDSGNASAFPYAASDMGCPSAGCTGYELNVDLDFDTNGNGRADSGDAYWNDGAGWVPIGDFFKPFIATFDGNGYTISNLFIKRGSESHVGLFASIGSPSVIRNTGSRSVNVTGDRGVGGLAGNNLGTITTSYATGSVTGARKYVGGLAGYNDGGTITASYATGSVTGQDHVGGLVGWSKGTITTSYATGSVTGSSQVGGLVGWNRSIVTNSYASGSVTGTGEDVGGLVGEDSIGTVTASYWDTETSGQTTSASGIGKTTSQLQSPTGYTGIYSDWNVDIDGNTGGDNPWDFGTASQYPKINYVPSVPVRFGAVIGDRQVTLRWATGPSILPITSYQFHGDGSVRWWQDILDSDASTTSHTVTGLKNGQTYTFRVRAENQAGSGKASDPVSVTPVNPVTISVDNLNPLVGQAQFMRAVLADSPQSDEATFQASSYQWERKFGKGWREVGPEAATKRVIFRSAQTVTYRVAVTLTTGQVARSKPITLTWRLPLVSVTPSDRTPVIGHAITVSANVESGGAGASSYQWERRFGEDWRDVGPKADTKRLIFHFGETATYRVAVTLTTGQEVRSEPITLTWRNTSVDVTSNNYNPQAPKLITLTANVTTAGEASPLSYQWQFHDAGDSWWANIGNDHNLVLTHAGGGLREYRVTVTMTDDEVVTSDPLSIEWRDP